ncbi:toll/interleukin-1 receptor domain-containing protein [Yoonia sp. R78084]|uniref:toll/interleukin-1 receptor domain-containing protein n=1 Tax=Yoonia sp. R78084 TaxID=3093869 RepID=UPI0037DD0268
MTLTPSERATFKTEIARRLSPQTWTEIDLVLEEFGANVTSWSGDSFSYVAAMLRGIEDEPLRAMAQHLNIETGEDSVFDIPEFWAAGKLRVFLSHLAKHKVFASELQAALASYGISAFVAHEDIEPNSEWQDEIEKALRTCDTLVALLHEGFKDSTWTDQEVGYALGRGVPVSSVRLDIAPYGLFGRKQAFNGKDKDAPEIARELFEAYRVHPKTAEKMADVVIEMFCSSTSFLEARSNVKLVEELTTWRKSYKAMLREAISSNSQIQHAWGVPESIEAVIEKRDPDSGIPAGDSVSDDFDEIPF